MPRRKPYSGKQKKAQLKAKRDRKHHKEKRPDHGSRSQSSSDVDSDDDDRMGQPPEGTKETCPLDTSSVTVTKLHQQPSYAHPSGYDPNRYRLQFAAESPEALASQKLRAQREAIVPVPMEKREHSVEDFYPEQAKLGLPKRPPWEYSLSKASLEHREKEYFDRYLKKMHSQQEEKLSFFEHNLETWRQLWRVLERSTVICIVADVRFAPLHFPSTLFNYITKELSKGVVLVLNKVDLVPPHVVVAWRHYFSANYPSLRVVCFTSHPDPESSLRPQEKVHLRFKRARGRGLSAVGPKELLQVVVRIHSGQEIDLSGWEPRLAVGKGGSLVAEDTSSDQLLGCGEEKEGAITIGMVGFPNAGKSSIINGLLGKKAVSVSRTPGHTKHFQTIYLSDSVILCDCPGLVFPAVAEKQLQVLAGIYPISQVREPYNVVGYLAQRVPLVSLLRLEHPRAGPHPLAEPRPPVKPHPPVEPHPLAESHPPVEPCTPVEPHPPAEPCPLAGPHPPAGTEQDLTASSCHGRQVWTAWDICDAWAQRRGYFTAKAARLDAYRAANSLLRLACDGRVCFYLCPPGFQRERGSWEGHPEVAEMMRLQRVGLKQVPEGKGHEEEEEDEEEESSSNDDGCGGLKQPTSTANRFAELNILDSCDS